MPVPFPSSTFPAGFTPYTLSAFVDPSLKTSAKSAWTATPAPTVAAWFDPNSLVSRVGSAISVTGSGNAKTLNITAAGNAMTFDLSGDGTARIPVEILTP